MPPDDDPSGSSDKFGAELGAVRGGGILEAKSIVGVPGEGNAPGAPAGVPAMPAATEVSLGMPAATVGLNQLDTVLGSDAALLPTELSAWPMPCMIFSYAAA